MHFRNKFHDENGRLLLEALAHVRPGWTILQDVVLPSDQEFPELQIEYVLAHPAWGIAILDIMPTRPTPNIAAQQMRRRLEAAGEAFAHADQPIVHVTQHHSNLVGLQAALDQAFGPEPAIRVRYEESSMAVLQGLLGATPLEPVPKAEPAGVSHALHESAIGLLKEKHRHVLKHKQPFLLRFAIWGAVVSVTGGAIGMLSIVAPSWEYPTLMVSPAPAVASKGVSPARSHDAQEFVIVPSAAPQAAQQGIADVTLVVAPIISATIDVPVPPVRAHISVVHAATPPSQELPPPPSILGAPSLPEALSSTSTATLTHDQGEQGPAAENVALSPVLSEAGPVAASVLDSAPRNTAVASDAAAGREKQSDDAAVLPPVTMDGWITGRPVQAGAASASEIAAIVLDQRIPSTVVSGGASPDRGLVENAPQVASIPQEMASTMPSQTAVERAPLAQNQLRRSPHRATQPAADSSASSPATRCRTIVLLAQLGEEMSRADRSFLQNGCGVRR